MIVVMMLAAAAAGALWAGIAGLLRLTVRVNEAITTLLLNYVAIDLMLYLIYQPWKDPNGSGQPATRSAGRGRPAAAHRHQPGPHRRVRRRGRPRP